MSDPRSSEYPDFRRARHPARVYRGWSDEDGCHVEVFDSAFPEESGNPRMLLPDASREVEDVCDVLAWGDESNAARQSRSEPDPSLGS